MIRLSLFYRSEIIQNKLFLLELLIILFFSNSCGPEENPNLVNPPSQTESVRVRLLNLAGDKLPRALLIDWKTQTSETPFGSASSTVKPYIDSTFPLILLAGNKDFQSTIKTKFVRSTNYTFIALPSAKGNTNFRNVDTVITLTTLTGILETNRTAFIQLFNANNDTTIIYSMTLGCPNGIPLAQNISYRMASPLVEIRTDSVAVSLIRIQYGIPEIIGLYRLNIVKNGQYALIVQRNSLEQEELWILDMKKESSDAFLKLNPVAERTSNIRVINFSNENVNVIKEPNEVIANNLRSNFIGKYTTVNSCLSELSDSISTYLDDKKISSTSLSLDVLQNYTYLVFDSANKSANMSIIAEPVRMNESLNNRAVIRVVHAWSDRQSLTISLGARDDQNSSFGYVSGDVLATNLSYGNISEPVLINSGSAPITIFTATQPAQLIYCLNTYFEPNKSYLLILANIKEGSLIHNKVSLIEEFDTEKQIQFLEEGVFTQFIHLTPGVENVQLSISESLTNSKVFYSGSLATVLTKGEHIVNVNGFTKNINAEVGKRLMIIAAGNKDNIDILEISNPPLQNSNNYYNRRIINASKEIPSITVRIDSDSGFIAAEWLDYGTASQPQQVYLERKISLFFMHPQDFKKTYFTLPDLGLSFNKSYSIIFGGDSLINGFTATVQQEY